MTFFEIQYHDVASAALDASVPVSVLAHPEAGQQKLPLIISLDGGVGERESLIKRKSIFDDLLQRGDIPALNIISFSGGPGVFFHGPWETWILEELPAFAESTLGAAPDPEKLLITGISGGGYGALKMAFKHPSRFRAVAAMEAVILPSLTWPAQHTRACWWMLEQSAAQIWGPPFDEARFLADHPPNLAVNNADAIRQAPMEIYLEVGDDDMLHLADGAEFLHRILWDHDIRHEYHQVRWADHGGSSIEPRLREACRFLAACLSGERTENRNLTLTEAEQQWVNHILSGGPQRGEAPPEYTVVPERENAVMSRLWEPLRQVAAAQDEDMARAYGRLPPSNS